MYAAYLWVHRVVALEAEELERHVHALFWTEEYLGSARLGLRVKHALLYGRVDLVYHLVVAPLGGVCDHTVGQRMVWSVLNFVNI